MPTIVVLMAAYNGAKWIEQQIQTILAQCDVSVTLYISVDLSSDDTFDICKRISKADNRVIVLPQENYRFGGAAKNFFRLIRDVDFHNFDYVTLADQDDIYIDGKFSRAVNLLCQSNACAYSCNVTAFWEDKKATKLIDKAQPQRKYDHLFEAAGPGCTYVLEASAMGQFKAFLMSHWQEVNEVSLHDWLIYAWFRERNLRWVIDKRSYILYRQHGGNQIGANTGLKALIARWKLIKSGWYRVEISKIANLAVQKSTDLPGPLFKKGFLPYEFLFRNSNQFRRKRIDNFVFFILNFFRIL